MIDHCTYDTPTGSLTVLADDGVVVAAGFAPAAELWERLPDHRRRPLTTRSDLGPITAAVEAYLGGDLEALATVPVDQPGTELQRKVWTELAATPAGQTRTYSDLAAAVGRPTAVRAVGSACGRNLIAPFVPCHRALRSDGTLGGYRYGLDVKHWLLGHEGAGR